MYFYYLSSQFAIIIERDCVLYVICSEDEETVFIAATVGFCVRQKMRMKKAVW
jgi:hypothetical protein